MLDDFYMSVEFRVYILQQIVPQNVLDFNIMITILWEIITMGNNYHFGIIVQHVNVKLKGRVQHLPS